MPTPKPPEFRRRALDLVAQGNPEGQVARHLGISESCLRRWMSHGDVDAGRKEGPTSSERKELVELRRRNRVLEMELDILKRPSAYFGRRNILTKQCSGWSTISRRRVSCLGDLPGLRGRLENPGEPGDQTRQVLALDLSCWRLTLDRLVIRRRGDLWGSQDPR